MTTAHPTRVLRTDRRTLLRGTALGAGALALGRLPTTGPAQAQSTPDPRTIEALARRFYDLFNSGDLTLLDRVLASDWADHPLSPGQGPGRAGFAPVVRAFRAAFPDLHLTNEDVIVARDKVVVRSTARGTHKGPFLGVAPTGRRVAFRAVDIHRIADGLIAETWHLEDLFAFLLEVKALPAR